MWSTRKYIRECKEQKYVTLSTRPQCDSIFVSWWHKVSNSEPGEENYMLEADREYGRVNISSDEHLGSLTKESV
jgi:hypothetical protein